MPKTLRDTRILDRSKKTPYRTSPSCLLSPLLNLYAGEHIDSKSLGFMYWGWIWPGNYFVSQMGDLQTFICRKL
jgi:hypothetical protein